MRESVPVESSFVVAIGRYGEDRLQSAVVGLDHAFTLESAQRLAELVGPGEVDLRCEREVSLSHVDKQRIKDVEQFGQGECSTLVVEKREGDESRGRNRRSGVDAVGDVEGHTRHHSDGVVGAGALARIGQALEQGQGFTEAHMHLAASRRLGSREPIEPAQALRGLLAAGVLEGDRLYLVLLVVHDRDRDEVDIFARQG